MRIILVAASAAAFLRAASDAPEAAARTRAISASIASRTGSSRRSLERSGEHVVRLVSGHLKVAGGLIVLSGMATLDGVLFYVG